MILKHSLLSHSYFQLDTHQFFLYIESCMQYIFLMVTIRLLDLILYYFPPTKLGDWNYFPDSDWSE